MPAAAIGDKIQIIRHRRMQHRLNRRNPRRANRPRRQPGMHISIIGRRVREPSPADRLAAGLLAAAHRINNRRVSLQLHPLPQPVLIHARDMRHFRRQLSFRLHD